MYGTELVVMYVDVSVRVDTLVNVVVSQSVVVNVWSIVLVVGLILVVCRSSQQYVTSKGLKRPQVRVPCTVQIGWLCCGHFLPA